MTDDTRGAIQDLAVVGVAAIAIYFVARNPSLRRTAWRAVKYGLFTAAPAFLWQETRRAWAMTAPPSHP
ncbi:MAG: hypothetical protein ACRD26_01160 [Vicinamibacterales bacterium]